MFFIGNKPAHLLYNISGAKKNYIRSKIRKIELCLPYFFIGILKICRLITYMINYFLKYNRIRKEYNRVIKCIFTRP